MANKIFQIHVRLGMAAALGLVMASAMMTGCGMGEVSLANDVSTYSNAGVLGGKVHGGQFPVAFASVKLYSAGTTGYGAGATLLATSPTGTDGYFSFPKSATNGPSSGTGTTWACPATTDDPQLYLISTGGNSKNSGLNDAADTNAAIGLFAAIGPCSKVGNSTFVIIDEESTAAGVTALAPYMSPGTTPGTEVVGTIGANLPTNPPQGAVGLNNAVASIANLMATSTPYTNTGVTSVATVTVTATPEAGKIALMGNILAGCVNNQTQTTTTNCAQLFGSAIPATGTTQAQDTIQAMYYMATNPTDLNSTVTAVPASCGSASSNLACIFGLAPGGGAPFGGALATQPTDWTMGVTYSATGSCSNNGFGGALFFDSPTKEAVDANGNIYIVNGSISKASIVEMSPVGQPLACVIPALTAATTAQTYGSGITIDPSGNVWAIFGHTTFTNSVAEWVAGATVPTMYSPAAEPFGITSDGDGNVFYTTQATSGVMYEFVAPTSGAATIATAPVVATPQLYSTNATTVLTVNAMAADTTGRVYVNTASIASAIANYPLTASITAVSAAGGVATFTAANTLTAGQTVTISGLTTTALNGRYVVASASGSSFTAATTSGTIASTSDAGSARATGASAYATALIAENSASYGIGLDSTGHVYTGTACCSNGGPGKLGKFTPATTATGTETGASSTAFLGGMNGTRALAIDGNNRAWMGEYWWETTTTATPAVNVYGLVEMGATGTGTSA